MTSALRWAAMTAILMFHDCEGQSHKTVSTDHNFWRGRRAEADSNRGPSASYQPNALPLCQTGSQSNTDNGVVPSFILCVPASSHVQWLSGVLIIDPIFKGTDQVLMVTAPGQGSLSFTLSVSWLCFYLVWWEITWECSRKVYYFIMFWLYFIWWRQMSCMAMFLVALNWHAPYM